MKLKEKFSELLPLYNVNNNKSIQCEKISDDYAIEFSEWVLLRHYLKLVKKDTTSKELLEIFKKEKGL